MQLRFTEFQRKTGAELLEIALKLRQQPPFKPETLGLITLMSSMECVGEDEWIGQLDAVYAADTAAFVDKFAQAVYSTAGECPDYTRVLEFYSVIARRPRLYVV